MNVKPYLLGLSGVVVATASLIGIYFNTPKMGEITPTNAIAQEQPLPPIPMESSPIEQTSIEEIQHYLITSNDFPKYEKNGTVSFGRVNPMSDPEWKIKLEEEKKKAEEEAQANNSPTQPSTTDDPTQSSTEPKAASEEITATSLSMAQQFGIPASWVLAVVEVESGFNPDAQNTNTNGTADRGLMQLNSNTAPWIASQLEIPYQEGMEFDVKTNIQMGTFFLNYLYQRSPDKNDIHYIFTAYNRGEAGAESWKKANGTYQTEYSQKVIQAMTKYQ